MSAIHLSFNTVLRLLTYLRLSLQQLEGNLREAGHSQRHADGEDERNEGEDGSHVTPEYLSCIREAHALLSKVQTLYI